jgi:hypothetical protein
MNNHLTETSDCPAERRRVGMNRFFDPRNIDRYRKLASSGIDATERRRVMQSLAEELNAFRQEAHTSASQPRN